MTGNKLKIFCQIVSIVLILSLSALLMATMLYTHIHVLPDGKIVVHSHALPFNGDRNGENHSHTQSEFLLIHLFYTLSFIVLFIVFSIIENRNVKIVKRIFVKSPLLADLSTSIVLRAPPAPAH